MKRFVVCIGILAGPAFGDAALPALHDVTGVTANDVLNLRVKPDASAAILGSLPPDLKGVEVVGLSEDGKWGRVNLGETSGWAKMTFLNAQKNPPWFALQSPINCGGTEPFWSFHIDPIAKTAHFVTPEEEGPEMDVTALWPGEDWRPVAAAQMTTDEGSALVTFNGEICFDGMSDTAYGLTADIFSIGTTAAPNTAMRGCCTLKP